MTYKARWWRGSEIWRAVRGYRRRRESIAAQAVAEVLNSAELIGTHRPGLYLVSFTLYQSSL